MTGALGGPTPPALVVLHGGEPDATELAALVVALGTIAAGPPTEQRSSGWADRRRSLRKPLDHGPGRWAASGRPAR